MPLDNSPYYSFLPHLRQGMALGIQHDDGVVNTPAITRPSVTIDFDLKGDVVGGNSNQLIESRSQTVQLFGPGDIIGVNPDAILRTAPLDWVTDFEYNFLPYVEFYEEDFPWRYSPARPVGASALTKKLKPWMALVVLKEGEFTRQTNAGSVLPSFKTTVEQSTIFPEHAQLWAWAHVHVNEGLGDNGVSNIAFGVSELNTLLNQNPNKGVSRIMCPRKLEAGAGYHAFLIPVYEQGRRAGLGLDFTGVDMLRPAWDDATPTATDLEFPIYHQWYFKTSATGDFEAMLEAIKPVVLDSERMGSRVLDIQNPGDTQYIGLAPSSTLGLGGAVRTLDYDPAADNSWDVTDANNDYVNRLRHDVNKPANHKEAVPTGDPVIAPPIYGRWHKKQEKLKEIAPVDDWISRANLDPRFRAFAGAGAQVVKQHQEFFMDICWNQVEDVVEANRRLRMMKLAEQATLSIYRRSVQTASNEEKLVLTNTLHDHVKVSTNTVYKDVVDSRIPTSAVTGAFRRAIRPGCGFAKSLSTTATPLTTSNLLTNLNTGTINVASAYTAPTGMLTASTTVTATFSPAWVTSQSPRSNYYLTLASAQYYPPGTGTSNTLVANNFRNTSTTLSGALSTSFMPAPGGGSMDMNASASAITTSLNPYTSMLAKANSVINVQEFSGSISTLSSLNEVMATPKIELPMVNFLYQVSPDLVAPKMNSIPQNSVGALGIDQRYVEAFMLGLNHEMMSELLWREYPTDQRGTVFSRFWGSLIGPNATEAEAEQARAIKNIHTWNSAELSKNYPAGGIDPSTLTILSVRADLFKKYPNTLVYANKAKWKDGLSGPDPELNRELDDMNIKQPVFYTQLGDIAFFGFDLDQAEAKGDLEDLNKPGWFFVFKEVVGEPNFGLDINGDTAPFSTWDEAGWESITTDFLDPNAPGISVTPAGQPGDLANDIIWGQNASDMAYILYRKPGMVAYHAFNMIK